MATLDRTVAELIDLAQRSEGRALMQFRSFVGAHQYHKLHRMMHDRVRPGARVLDWGAGNGHFSYVLGRSGYRATAYSLAIGSLDWLSPAIAEVVYGSHDEPVALPFCDASFDAVASVGVLEHVREVGGSDLGSLQEIRRVLRPGGVFLCAHLPRRHSLIEALATVVPGKHHHRYRYTAIEIERLFKAARLMPEEIQHYGVLPRNIWQYAPRVLRFSRSLANAWDIFDDMLAWPLWPVSQNYLIAARA